MRRREPVTARELLDRAGLVEFTRRLVRAPSVNQPELGRSEALAVDIVVEQARAFGWNPTVEEVAPGRPNVKVTISGGHAGKTLLFEGHTDVVTEGDVEDWSFDPFGGELVDGKVLGRGAADMKGGLAAMIYAARAIELAGPFPGTIVLAILCDEEEMMIGVHDFVARGHADDVDAAIVCEPEAGEICTVQKGAIRLRVDLDGEMAHGAMPHQGRNPVLAAGLLVARLTEFEQQLRETFGDDPRLGYPYLTPTHVAGGSLGQLNVIPGAALLTYDIRTVPGLEHAEVLGRIEEEAAMVTAATGVAFSFEAIVDRPATHTPISHPVVQAVAEAHRTVTGSEPRYGGVPGTTDGTILWRDAQIPVVVYGPGGKWIAHQKDEFVEVSHLVTAAEVYIEAAYRFLS